MSAEDVEAIYARAKQGVSSKVSVDECLLLKQHLDPSRPFPVHCNQLIAQAKEKGGLARRNSRVAKAWDISDGHGVRKVGVNEVEQSLDTVQPGDSGKKAQSTSDIYKSSRTPEQQEKIRQLQVRTASRGAKPRINEDFYGSAETQEQVRTEVKKELVRRQSRRNSLRKQPDAVAA